MASTITDIAINEAAGLSNQAKWMLMKVNDGTASLLDVGASLLDLEEKAILRDLVNATATRVRINSRKASLPFKSIALQIANV